MQINDILLLLFFFVRYVYAYDPFTKDCCFICGLAKCFANKPGFYIQRTYLFNPKQYWFCNDECFDQYLELIINYKNG